MKATCVEGAAWRTAKAGCLGGEHGPRAVNHCVAGWRGTDRGKGAAGAAKNGPSERAAGAAEGRAASGDDARGARRRSTGRGKGAAGVTEEPGCGRRRGLWGQTARQRAAAKAPRRRGDAGAGRRRCREAQCREEEVPGGTVPGGKVPAPGAVSSGFAGGGRGRRPPGRRGPVAGVAAVPYPGDGARDRRTGVRRGRGNQPFRLVSIPAAWTPSTRPFDRDTGPSGDTARVTQSAPLCRRFPASVQHHFQMAVLPYLDRNINSLPRVPLENHNQDMRLVFLPDLLPEPVAFGSGFAL
jgi:hypothetical protein